MPLSIPGCFHQSTSSSLGRKPKHLVVSHYIQKRKCVFLPRTGDATASLVLPVHVVTQQHSIGLKQAGRARGDPEERLAWFLK